MSLTYATNLTQLALLGQFPANDPNFLSNLPSCIDYATDRITRELNLLNTVTANSTLQLSTGTRVLNIGTLNPVFNVVTDINVLTPAGASSPDTAARVPLTIQSRAFMNQVYGTSPTQAGVRGVPEYFTMVTDQIIQVGPYPDAAYFIEIIGTARPVPISDSNETSWMTTYLPDLFLAAEMVQLSGYMRNFGAMSDNPQQAVAWEQQYTALRDSAAVEDAMRKYAATGYTPVLPSQFNEKRT